MAANVSDNMDGGKSIMTIKLRNTAATVLILLSGASLSACGTTDTGTTAQNVFNAPPAPPPSPLPPPPPRNVVPPVNRQASTARAPVFMAAPGLTGRQRLKLAVDLLGRGEADHAKVEVETFLKDQPDSELGKSLLSQITEDPRAVLGAQSFSYTVQPGETLASLAEKFLDDRFKFYVLARYNGVNVPTAPQVGRVLQIPGTQRRGDPRKVSTMNDEALIQARLAPPRRTPPPAVAVTPNNPAAPPPVPPRAVASRNPARANELRGQALEMMSKGSIAQAVALLQQALTLDPGSSVIKRDLDRAKRILSGVK